MSTKSKIVLLLALALGTASVATAATKHSAHLRQSGIVPQVAPGASGNSAYDSKYGYDGVPTSNRGFSSSAYPSSLALDPEFIAPQGLR
jgi:hypothetical protein